MLKKIANIFDGLPENSGVTKKNDSNVDILNDTSGFVGRVDSNVLFGKDGFLFLYQGGQKQFDYLLRKASIQENKIENFVNNIRGRSEFCKKNNIDYLHVVFPSKPVVCGEKLPDGFDVRSIFSSRHSVSDVLYPIDVLKGREDVFLTKDTHMTGLGDWVVFSEILRKLGLFGVIENDEPLLVLRSYQGDLNTMLNIDRKSPELFYKQRNIAYRVSNADSLKGNTGRVIITRNPEAKIDKRLLLIGDSFLISMLDIFSDYFSDIIIVRHPCFSPDLVGMYEPDIVLTANAERYLCSIPSDEGSLPFLLRDSYRYNYDPNDDFLDALKANLSYSNFNRNYRSWQNLVDSWYYRDKAIRANLSGDLPLAKSSIEKAIKLNPNGPYILELSKKFTLGEQL